MHNIKPYEGDAFSLYNDAVQRKEDGDSKNRLNESADSIKSYFDEYDACFRNNSLHTIIPNRVTGLLRKDLYDMYRYDSAIVRTIRNELRKNNPVTVIGICQYCGIVPDDTMDHILPHTKYAEYSVHARNLIPCCTDCNRRKNEQELLNMYTDILPQVEYLVMDVVSNGDTIDFVFKLDNSNKLVDMNLFSKITDHFSKLALLERMKTRAVSQLSSFIFNISMLYNKLGKDSVIESVNEEIDGLRQAYGYNYWEVAFKKGLINSPIFWKYYSNGSLF